MKRPLLPSISALFAGLYGVTLLIESISVSDLLVRAMLLLAGSAAGYAAYALWQTQRVLRALLLWLGATVGALACLYAYGRSYAIGDATNYVAAGAAVLALGVIALVASPSDEQPTEQPQ